MSPTLHNKKPVVRGREGDTPVRATCEILARRREGAYWTISLSAPEIAERAHAGQFINVAVGATSTLLRRPFSISKVTRQGPAAGTVDFVFDAHGPGTEWLADRTAHEVLDVVGPLGNAFPLPKQKVPCLLVGGGYGVAPLFMLAEDLRKEGLRVDMIVGAATQERIFNAIEAKRITASVTFTTDDGSFGEKGRVTDVLEKVTRDCGTQVVYACGPMPMLRAVAEACMELGIPCQVAVEEHMACGVGICWTCVVPTRTKDGELRMKRSCIDGPVFNGSKVAWDESRWDTGPAVPDEPEEEPVEPVRMTDDDLWGDR